MKSMQIKKLATSTIAAATIFAAMSPAAQAASASLGFTVDINVTPTCTIAIPAPALVINYIDGGVAASAATTVDATCTNGAGFILSMDAIAPAAAANYGPIADPDTALNYTLSFNVDGVTGGDTATLLGTGAVAVSTPLTAAVAAGQFATCAAPTCLSLAPQNHTVFINY